MEIVYQFFRPCFFFYFNPPECNFMLNSPHSEPLLHSYSAIGEGTEQEGEAHRDSAGVTAVPAHAQCFGTHSAWGCSSGEPV